MTFTLVPLAPFIMLDPNARIVATPPLWEIKCSTYVAGNHHILLFTQSCKLLKKKKW
jgi:hypothetical protein